MTVKKNYSGEDKQKIFTAILREEMTARQVSEQWGIPISTAKEWVKYANEHNGKPSRGRGRPLLVGISVRSELIEEVKKKAENDEALKLLSNDSRDAEVVKLVRDLQKKANPNITAHISERYIKELLPQCDIIRTSAQVKNQKRFAAERDVLNALNMCALAAWVHNNIPNKALVVNLDSTSFEHDLIKRNKKHGVAVHKDTIQHFRKMKKPLNTRVGTDNSGDTGVITKHHAMMSYGGFYGPHVISLSHSHLQPGQGKTYPVMGLGKDPDDIGFIHIGPNRNNTPEFYNWLFEHVIVPFFERIRKSVQDFESPALLLFDGEISQCTSALNDETRTLLIESKILIAKRSPNTTAITQELDVSTVFSAAHRFASGQEVSSYIRTANHARTNIINALNNFYAEFKVKKDHHKKWVNAVLRTSYGYGEATRVSKAVKAYKKVGIITEHEPNYGLIMSNFHIKHADMQAITQCLPDLVNNLQQFGHISDKTLHDTKFVKGLVASKLIAAYNPSHEPTEKPVHSWRLAMILHKDVRTAYLRKKQPKRKQERSETLHLPQQDKATQGHAKKKVKVGFTLNNPNHDSAHEVETCKATEKALREERNRIAEEKKVNRMLREAGRLTNSKRKRDEAGL